MALSNSFFHRMISLMRDQVIDKVNSTETLSDIRSWIDAVSNRSSAAVSVVLLGGFITSIALVNMTRDFTGPLSGFRLTLFLWLFLSQAFILLIFLIFTLVLSVRIRRFDLALFEADPANSEIITQISSWFSNTVFLVAAYGALQTFGLIRFGLITYYASLLLAFWTPTLAIFITCHLSLSAIIQRNKWKTLNAVQKKISAIQSGKAAISKGSREYLVWLLDYHERVKGTRNSSINLMSGVSFLNSLLLPVIAFILGNLDIITKFFSSKP